MKGTVALSSSREMAASICGMRTESSSAMRRAMESMNAGILCHVRACGLSSVDQRATADYHLTHVLSQEHRMATMRARLVPIVLTTIALHVAAIAAAPPVDAPSKRDAAVRAAPGGTVRVIITTQPGSTAAVSDRLRQRGRPILASYSVINAVVADATADDLSALEADPGVADLSLDAAVVAEGDQPATETDSCTALRTTLGLTSQSPSGTGV